MLHLFRRIQQKLILVLLTGLCTTLFSPGVRAQTAANNNSPAGGIAMSEPVIGTLKFVESFPEGTVLDTPEFPEARDIWPVVLAEATTCIDVASFYFSRLGDGSDTNAPVGLTDPLLNVIGALKHAAHGGVPVRILGDVKFQKTYPEVLSLLDSQVGIQSRVIDAGAQWGGVMHAKYFIVDEQTLYVGSQNWDWRSLSQIRELGALITHPQLARDLKRIFDLDWSLAGGELSTPAPVTTSQSWAEIPQVQLQCPDGSLVQAALAASPRAGLPDGIPWDLPLLVEMMNSARETLHLQMLSYNPSDREGNYFADLENGLRSAAARGVEVQMLVSNWAKVYYVLPWLQSLAAVKNLNVKFSNIPEHERGFIPFARVEHAKYLVVDGQRAWLGTSNGSADYFHASRNISLFFEGSGAAEPLDRFFQRGWNSPYVETVDPCGEYQPPRRK